MQKANDAYHLFVKGSYIGHTECEKNCSPNNVYGATTCSLQMLQNGCIGYCGCGNYKCEKCDCSKAPVCTGVYFLSTIKLENYIIGLTKTLY